MKCQVCKKPTTGPCLSCVDTLMKSGQMPPVDPSKTGWVLCRRTEESFLFITIHGRLCIFESKADAEAMLPVLTRGKCDITGITTEEVRIDVCWAYAILKGLELGKATRNKN